ncbi:MAG: transposase family protein [Actinomycetota bacterium]|nr:transposase family protein [Actinomycetota bacterium]
MVVRRVVQEGDTFAQAAAWANVSKSTVWEWVRRWREATAAEQASLACLAARRRADDHTAALDGAPGLAARRLLTAPGA